MRVRYTETARREAEAIFERIIGDNPRAASAVVLAIKNAITTLGTFPRIGTATNDPAVFTKIARPYRYLIFYSIEGQTVLVRRIRHPARNRLRR